jgi:hypothetical protein
VNRSLNDPDDQQGLVVANDSDTDRAYMLGMTSISQCRKLFNITNVCSSAYGISIEAHYLDLSYISIPFTTIIS